MALTVLFILLAVFLILGVPVAVALGGASLAYIMIKGLPDVLLIHRMIGGIDSFPLLAIPFFIGIWGTIGVVVQSLLTGNVAWLWWTPWQRWRWKWCRIHRRERRRAGGLGSVFLWLVAGGM